METRGDADKQKIKTKKKLNLHEGAPINKRRCFLVRCVVGICDFWNIP